MYTTLQCTLYCSVHYRTKYNWRTRITEYLYSGMHLITCLDTHKVHSNNIDPKNASRDDSMILIHHMKAIYEHKSYIIYQNYSESGPTTPLQHRIESQRSQGCQKYRVSIFLFLNIKLWEIGPLTIIVENTVCF